MIFASDCKLDARLLLQRGTPSTHIGEGGDPPSLGRRPVLPFLEQRLLKYFEHNTREPISVRVDESR
jgi:hypothetical protein